MKQFIHFYKTTDTHNGTMCVNLPKASILVKAEKAFKEDGVAAFLLETGFAVCSKEDQFSKKIGREISENQMHLRHAIVNDVRKETITTKKGSLEKTVLRCCMVFSFYANCESLKLTEAREMITMSVDFDITHVGPKSDPRMHCNVSDQFSPIKYAFFEKQTKWIRQNRE